MKIVKLTAENIKKLVAVEITPKGDVVEITGKNGAGKSSVLDAIWWAVSGTKHIQSLPIRKGQNKARIKLDLGELIVERRFTDKGSTVSVESADGARYTSPQTMLDALLGALTFDPLAFVNEEAREQFETLRGIVELDVDVDALDRKNAGDFERRADLNRSARQLRAQADGIQVAPDVPAEPIDTEALITKIADAGRLNTALERVKASRREVERDIEEIGRRQLEQQQEAASLRSRAEACDRRAGEFELEAQKLREKLAAIEDPPAAEDVAAIQLELEAAQQTNRLVEQRGRKAQFEHEAADLETQARDLTATMDARTKAKADAIARAKMPVDGLGLGDGVVTFNGVPFDQASTAEQLRVSVAIAMAANPKLRVIRIKEGSLLDAENLALIATMARERDYQVWIERVDTSGKVGIVIDDGAVVAVNEAAQ